MRTFTIVEEARHADRLRVARDRTDLDIAEEYVGPVSHNALRKFIAEQRGEAEYDLRFWQSDTAATAVSQVYKAAAKAGVRDFDGTTLTVSMTNLVVTATLSTTHQETS